MKRRYVSADVFTETKLSGNPAAIVLDSQGLSAAQMQAIACEFGYSETTFVLPPRNPAHTAWVRIFTPSREVPFAGHPNIGTAFVLATQAAARRQPLPELLMFEEIAGVVPVRQLKEGAAIVGAELVAPEPLTLLSQVSASRVAACLSLGADDIRIDGHAPQIASVGLPFLVAELASRDALRRCVPNLVAFRSLLPIDGAVSIYVYTREVDATEAATHCDLAARMFTPRMSEDPATGSAAAAMAALVAEVRGVSELSLRVAQGVDMGRASLLLVKVDTRDDRAEVRVGGRCVGVMEGTFELAGDE